MSENKLSLVAQLETKNFVSGAKRMQNEIKGMQRELGKFNQKTNELGRALTRNLTLPFAAGATAAVKFAADLETLETSFVSLTGGAAQAAAAVAMLNDFTAKTPFQLDAVAGSARQLLAAGSGIEDLAGQLQFLGDIAATTGQPINEIASIFAKVNAKGKVELESLNQLAERGIPIFTALSEATGLLPSELGGGNVTVADFNKVLRAFSEEGGFANGAMERLSETFNGKLSTATDNAKLALASLGETILPLFKDLLDRVISVAQSIQSMSDSTKRAIVKFAAFAAAFGPIIFGVRKIAASVVGFGVSLRNASTLSAGLRAAMTGMLGPIGLVTTALSLVVTAAITEKLDQYAAKLKTIEDRLKRVNEAAVKGETENLKQLRGEKELLSDIISLQDNKDSGNRTFLLGSLIDGLGDEGKELARTLYRQFESELGRSIGTAEFFDILRQKRSALNIEIANEQERLREINLENTRKEEEAKTAIIRRQLELRRKLALEAIQDEIDKRAGNIDKATRKTGLEAVGLGDNSAEGKQNSSLQSALRRQSAIQAQLDASDAAIVTKDAQIEAEIKQQQLLAKKVQDIQKRLGEARKANTKAAGNFDGTDAETKEQRDARLEYFKNLERDAEKASEELEQQRQTVIGLRKEMGLLQDENDGLNLDFGAAKNKTAETFITNLVADSKRMRGELEKEGGEVKKFSETVSTLVEAYTGLANQAEADGTLGTEEVQNLLSPLQDELIELANKGGSLFSSGLSNSIKAGLADLNQQFSSGLITKEELGLGAVEFMKGQYESALELKRQLADSDNPLVQDIVGDFELPPTFTEFLKLYGVEFVKETDDISAKYSEFAAAIGNTTSQMFSELLRGTADFGQMFENLISNLIAKIAGLVAAFAVISAILPTSAVAQAGLGSFLTGGLGLPTGGSGQGAGITRTLQASVNTDTPTAAPGFRAAQGGEINQQVEVTGVIKGSDIHLLNARGARSRSRAN